MAVSLTEHLRMHARTQLPADTKTPHPYQIEQPQTSPAIPSSPGTQSIVLDTKALYSPSDDSSTTIEPDPLPAHSNPQVLTLSQTHAFQDSERIPPLRIGKDAIQNLESGLMVLRIEREAAHMLSIISTKPIVRVRSATSGSLLGSIRFHAITSNDIDLSLHGRSTALSHSGLVHSRWEFRPTTRPEGEGKWHWKKDKITGGAKLGDARKGGNVLARMKGDLLTFETSRLSTASYDEVLLSAVAMVEAARRQKRNGDIVDIASAMGDFASTTVYDGEVGGRGNTV